jgi:hypothetical protein
MMARFSADGTKVVVVYPSGFTMAFPWRDSVLVQRICRRLMNFDQAVYTAACK